MDTIMRNFSSIVTKQRDDGWLELSYDDSIRVAMARRPPVTAAASGSPLGEPATGLLRLQGTGIASVTCPDPDCIKGIPPLRKEPDQVVFWMDLPETAAIESMDGWPSCLIIPGSGGRIAVPIFDAVSGTEWAEGDELTAYRKRIRSGERVAFHVYRIAVAPGPLAALQNRRIALPIPCELVISAGAVVRIRSSA
jgi:hypothetical protein